MSLEGRRAGVHAVHSLQGFAMSVPALDEAQGFFSSFGLDARPAGNTLALHAAGHPHRWGTVREGARKKLDHVTFGAFAEDIAPLAERAHALGCTCEPDPASDGEGRWIRDPDGVPIQVVAAERVTVSAPPAATARLPGARGAPARSKVEAVRPRRLAHLLRFTPDVPRMLAFYRDALGLRLSDHSGDVIAFMHAPHGSDHHVLAFAKSEAPGLHHTSWEVGSIEEVGQGGEQMRVRGHAEGWGVGRHVLGSNYFYYVRDPWKGWCEYSFDIDYIGADVEWQAADHPAEDAIYVWGPPMHPEFIRNFEANG